MTTKQVKSKALSLSIISAISVLPLLAGTLVNAQTASPQNNGVSTQTNQLPTQQNQFPNQQNQSPSELNQPLIQPSQNTTPSNTPNTNNNSGNQTVLLRLGSQGQAVRNVQAFLGQQGFYNGRIDGVYGPETRQAVMAYQKSRNLIADGVVGDRTWNSMSSQPNQASAF